MWVCGASPYLWSELVGPMGTVDLFQVDFQAATKVVETYVERHGVSIDLDGKLSQSGW